MSQIVPRTGSLSIFMVLGLSTELLSMVFLTFVTFLVLSGGYGSTAGTRGTVWQLATAS